MRLRSVPSGLVPVIAMPAVSFQSRAEVVAQPASRAASVSVVPGWPFFMYP